MHEHCRSDRDSYVIFHADRVTDDMDQYEKDDTSNKTENRGMIPEARARRLAISR
jgi:hypothetical protein